VDASNSAIGLAVTKQLSLRNTTSSVLVAQEVEADSLRSVVILTPKVNGNVKTVFTPVTALAAGAGFAAGLWVLRRLAAGLNPVARRRR
jgi:hypothetical protein